MKKVSIISIKTFSFKVPGLRDLELTESYFYPGSWERQKEAVSVMKKYQLGRMNL